MKKKNPERGVTQINDQKKLRMKGEKSIPSFLLKTHTGLIYYKEYRDTMGFPPLLPCFHFLTKQFVLIRSCWLLNFRLWKVYN